MNTKRLTPLSITLIFISISLTSIAYSETIEKFEFCSFKNSGVLLEIEAAIQVWPGENASITVRATAEQANVHIRHIYINIFKLEENGTKTLLRTTEFLKDAHLKLGSFREATYDVLIPVDTMPGFLYGEVEFSWSIEGDVDAPEDLEAFHITYVQNKPYEDLRQDYDALNGFCNDLQANYTDLQERCLQLESKLIGENNATSLMYLFLITTAILTITTILLLVRRPKTTTW